MNKNLQLILALIVSLLFILIIFLDRIEIIKLKQDIQDLKDAYVEKEYINNCRVWNLHLGYDYNYQPINHSYSNYNDIPCEGYNGIKFPSCTYIVNKSDPFIRDYFAKHYNNGDKITVGVWCMQNDKK